MAKILLVEDDNNLREIYQARLEAEGYVIVSAKDGEEGLVAAKKERPDAVVADVMMPRVSGFEFVDIIRNTPELKDMHIIMLTALGQAEDKTRADSLGVDRYLVKSQVTLEDIVKAVADVLAGTPANAAASAAAVAEPVATATPPNDTVASAPPVSTPAPDSSAPTVPLATPANIPVATPPADTSVPANTSQPTDTSVPVSTAQVDTPATTQPTEPAGPPKITIPVSAPPADPAVTATPTPATMGDDQVMADAMKELIASTSNPPATPSTTAAPVDLSATQPTEPVNPPTPPVAMPAGPAAPPTAPSTNLIPQDIMPPAPQAAPAPVAPTPVPVQVTPPDSDDSDNVTVANKKIIRPLVPASDGAPTPSTDINELLAKENVGHIDDAHPATGFLNPNGTDHPHTPGNVISPTNSPAASIAPNPNDPSSISL